MWMQKSTVGIFMILLGPRIIRGLSTTATSSAVRKNVAVPGLKNGMDYVNLGDSDLVVSKVCMGTMTFGEQNTLQEGVEQLQLAFDQYGVNFLDTAEMYPVPTRAETQGRTDQAVSMFLKTRPRESIILASKISGRSSRSSWLPRPSSPPGSISTLTRSQIMDSVDASLQRLGTDYIDLIQLHWADRFVGGLFGAPDFSPSNYEKAPTPVPFEEQLSALQELVQAGKVRHIGISNESPYGVCSMAELHKAHPTKYPKIVSIQNSYSLVNRKDFEAGLSEACYHHNVGLLAYSPLAGGTLTGKYSQDPPPSKARLMIFAGMGFMKRYLGSYNEAAVNSYCKIAQEEGLTPAQLALSWCYHRELVTSTIIGATTMEQLQENLKSYDVRLSEEAYGKILKVYQQYTDPTKAM